ncbi:DUF1501 domain-containing protein [Fimbriiglobus ruber]|uniref:DUF1501 domain-containing protein n=1 Tax=Fimbriiglobus ruber TaxID=1908690 RepID=A0A225DPL5_9BACT|nr:DUF1501 domain-containing protein [Fimbriiglobus ruber]OWK43332.1 hypothetical protein FRUB_02931 [Fimbriiglobus ruber]
MFTLWNTSARSGVLDRRELLRVGGLGMAGLSLPLLTSARATASAKAAPKSGSFGKAKNCIILYLSGGPAQLDTFDPKPDAPVDIRGEFGTIQTSLPGVRFSDLLPLSAKWMHKSALVRTMYHEHNDHGRGSYWMFTGYPYLGSVSDVNSMSRADMPHMGSCVAKLAPGAGPMFPFALVPHRMDVAGGRRSGQFAGSLGGKYDPLLTGGNPNDDAFKLEHLPLAPNEDAGVVRRRLSLVDQLNAQAGALNATAMSQAIHENQIKALEVLSSPKVRQAVDLSAVAKDERERYGRNLFGQSVMLGRRLLDAGARLVQCNWQRTQGKNGFAWDTHWNNFSAHKEDLVPPFDLAFHALMTDLEKTGKLDETLVVVAAEFGRSPKVTRSNAGREHWPDCYSVLFAGGGIRGGQVYGQSDKNAAYPATNPTTPADFTATIYHCLGIDPAGETHDQVGRPIALSKGTPIAPLVG